MNAEYTVAELAQNLTEFIPPEEFIVVSGAAVIMLGALRDRRGEHDLDASVSRRTYNNLRRRPGWREEPGATFRPVLRLGDHELDVGTDYGQFSHDEIAKDYVEVNALPGIRIIHPIKLHAVKTHPIWGQRSHDLLDAQFLEKYVLPQFTAA